MRILTFLLALYVLSFSPLSSIAEEPEIPEGMEIQKVGDLQILVPKGAEVTRTGKGGLIKVESTSEFASRELMKMNQRLEALERSQEKLMNDLEELKDAIDTLRTENASLRSSTGSLD